MLKRRNDVDFKKIVVDLEFTQPKKFEWILSLLRLPISPQRLILALIDHNIISHSAPKVKWVIGKIILQKIYA